MQDRKEMTERVSHALDATTARLRERHHVSDLEIARAMLASGIAKLSGVMSFDDVAAHLAEIAIALGETAEAKHRAVN